MKKLLIFQIGFYKNKVLEFYFLLKNFFLMENFILSEDLIVSDYLGSIEGVILANYFNIVIKGQREKIIEDCGKFFRFEFTIILFFLLGAVVDTRLFISRINYNFYKKSIF